jgi:hypothetical protein
MIRTAFEVTSQDIRNLGSASMVRLLEYLLLAEARLTGIPLADINVPLQITIADGGEDARIFLVMWEHLWEHCGSIMATLSARSIGPDRNHPECSVA